MITHVRVKHRNGNEEDIYVPYGGFVGHVFPDGSVVIEVIHDGEINWGNHPTGLPWEEMKYIKWC